ncbi:MAG: response regulator [Rhodospirillaceae bacterium]|nr:response regulator [Rhodospirillaceae bacterium]
MNQTQSKPGDTEDLGNLHVLLVDDDNDFLDLIQTLLNAVGVGHVSRARSGREAFEVLQGRQRVVDVVLCDHNMAGGTGLELLWVVRTGQVKSFRPDACFLLLTASGDHETVATAARLDVSGYLVKPVTPQKLHAAITQGRKRAIKIDFNKYKHVQLPQPG